MAAAAWKQQLVRRKIRAYKTAKGQQKLHRLSPSKPAIQEKHPSTHQCLTRPGTQEHVPTAGTKDRLRASGDSVCDSPSPAGCGPMSDGSWVFKPATSAPRGWSPRRPEICFDINLRGGWYRFRDVSPTAPQLLPKIAYAVVQRSICGSGVVTNEERGSGGLSIASCALFSEFRMHLQLLCAPLDFGAHAAQEVPAFGSRDARRGKLSRCPTPPTPQQRSPNNATAGKGRKAQHEKRVNRKVHTPAAASDGAILHPSKTCRQGTLGRGCMSGPAVGEWCNVASSAVLTTHTPFLFPSLSYLRVFRGSHWESG